MIERVLKETSVVNKIDQTYIFGLHFNKLPYKLTCSTVNVVNLKIKHPGLEVSEVPERKLDIPNKLHQPQLTTDWYRSSVFYVYASSILSLARSACPPPPQLKLFVCLQQV